MGKSIQTSLCKGLRACGIPKDQSHQILNTVEKWLRESGVEWTNSRIKDLRQWYETILAGDPKIPRWFRHTKDGYPTGIWNWVFKLPPAKALGVLSLNTCFYEAKLSKTQEEKFLHGLAGNKSQDSDFLERMSTFQWKGNLPKEMPEILFPTVFDMNKSIPVHDGRSSVRPDQKLGVALKALRLSWESVPQVTFDFLDRQGLLGYMPLHVLGNEHQLELNRPHDRCVGRVSVIQQPQLKARIVGNPNRVVQVTLDPLKDLFMRTARKLPTDVTFNQELGVAWVQAKLRQGFEIAGSDLTSASDLLDVGLSLALVDRTFGFPKVTGYEEYRRYFLEVSRAIWWCPDLNREVQWQQGDVLGTGPSFGLLTLTNNASALAAWKQARADGAIDETIPWSDSFRIVGDDIVMLAPMEPYYTRIIEALGGEINHSKTIKSNRVAEFAGRVVTSNCSYLKAIKYKEPSDNSFMSYVAQLGDQAKSLLLPKQRQVYDLLKEIPGVAVSGPWMPDSYGIPLRLRYQWYLEEVEPSLGRDGHDLIQKDYDLVLLEAQMSLAEADQNNDALQLDEPLIDDGYLPSQVTPTFKVGGDPRLTNGKTLLEVLHQHVEEGDILPFEDWLQKQYGTSWTNTSSTHLSDPRPPEMEATETELESVRRRLGDPQIPIWKKVQLAEKLVELESKDDNLDPKSIERRGDELGDW